MSAVDQTVVIVDEVIEAAGRRECEYYDGKRHEESRDETIPLEVQQLLNVIAQVAMYHFREENTHEPFAPMVQTSEGRSPIPADLDEEDLARLRALADRVSAPELKARCYDVLWLRKREYALAERALRFASLFRRKESALFGHAASLLQTWVN